MMEFSTTYHIPVMLQQCIEGLNINPEGTYVDVTFGGGGHSRELFKHISQKGRLIAFDQDPDAFLNSWNAVNFTFVPANFAFVSNHLKMLKIKQVDGVLADLGVSSHQFDEKSRGFSIRSDAPLDMRMNKTGELNAAIVSNEYDEATLYHIFREYGEMSNARKIASEIVRSRQNKRIETTFQLMEAVNKCAPKHKEHKFYAQLFQAIRIEVNQEISVLRKFLEQSKDFIKPGGRLVVLSYHSLEDRLVKNYFKRGSFDGSITKDFFGNILKPFKEINRHPIIPDENEMNLNPRSRSAKLRIAVRNE